MDKEDVLIPSIFATTISFVVGFGLSDFFGMNTKVILLSFIGGVIFYMFLLS